MASDSHLARTITTYECFQELRQAVEDIDDNPSFLTGTWNIPKSKLALWYKRGDAASYIKFPPSHEEDLKHLSKACLTEANGVGRLAASDFCIDLGLSFPQLLGQSARNLLGMEREDRKIRAELFEVNFLGPNASFKAPESIPAVDDRFGTLILVLPTEHQGGTLIVRDTKGEYKFESSHMPQSASSKGEPYEVTTVAWVAFHNHLEHEVMPVVSGVRVTLTFNLHFSDSPVLPNNTTITAEAPDFLLKLKARLDDPSFLPLGGRLGFGLKYKYSFSAESKLKSLITSLKGADGAVVKTLNHLGLKTSLVSHYDLEELLEDPEGEWGPPEQPPDEWKRYFISDTIISMGELGSTQLHDEFDYPECIRDSRDTKTVLNRGFVYVRNNEDSTTKRTDTEEVKVTTQFDNFVCDLGTKIVKKVLERETVTKNRETGKKTSTVDEQTVVQETEKAAGTTGSKAKPNMPVINWISPNLDTNVVQTYLKELNASIVLLGEVPPYEKRRVDKA
ncbi:hypothetical protein SISNIDRAFT_552709 [Sistotremastrum niveocremeum HHB9708]|uniref:Fe2OG dioxygenase domain-containing protein n=1 Tax=Sistotremastrum niveocremeum HHB9708 TaxID=1314777 RepID=A0A164P1N7_9AGAM|nr:hypothetical protein SISNIDRAFT_552709 [Sistotremastrum niveocremeum HHB9708]